MGKSPIDNKTGRNCLKNKTFYSGWKQRHEKRIFKPIWGFLWMFVLWEIKFSCNLMGTKNCLIFTNAGSSLKFTDSFRSKQNKDSVFDRWSYLKMESSLFFDQILDVFLFTNLVFRVKQNKTLLFQVKSLFFN